MLAAEGSHDDATSRSAPYAFYRTHVALLLREAGLRRRAPTTSPTSCWPRWRATDFRYHRGARGSSRCEELADAHADLCARLLDSPR